MRLTALSTLLVMLASTGVWANTTEASSGSQAPLKDDSQPPLKADSSPPLKAVVTIGMLGDVVKEIGGECVAVTTMMGPGVDPHLYQASARDIHQLGEAELILYSGYELEGRLSKVLNGFSHRKPTVAVSEEAIPQDEVIHSQDSYGVDPHLWMDSALWARTVPVVAKVLGKYRPQCEDAIQSRAESYTAELSALNDWIQTSVASIPEQQRILVTAHDAFNYYGRAYDIEVAGIQGLSTSTESGVADIRRMARLVAQRQVPAMFVESTINPRTVQAVIDAAADVGHQVNIGGELYSDAMGENGTADGTYIGMLVANTRTIVEALGGQPSPLPDALDEWQQRWRDVETRGADT